VNTQQTSQLKPSNTMREPTSRAESKVLITEGKKGVAPAVHKYINLNSTNHSRGLGASMRQLRVSHSETARKYPALSLVTAMPIIELRM
jgi:hypothetical protein